jgi:hypothetical protein
LQLFLGTTEICQPFYLEAKNVNKLYLTWFFNEDSIMGSVIFVPFEVIVKKYKNTTFVRFGDYYLSITLWGHSFLISLH